jgi:hypothetical protein
MRSGASQFLFYVIAFASASRREEERRSNRMDSFLVENLAIASLHSVSLAMTEPLKKWDAPYAIAYYLLTGDRLILLISCLSPPLLACS